MYVAFFGQLTVAGTCVLVLPCPGLSYHAYVDFVCLLNPSDFTPW